ncbi:uncharacterized protein L201_005660 [Kwoniella dendrophila CBS 6074]|uniref:LIM zinc-binding domain-containing protein n=1 Tax=Kwoniella dendrophila CBS 6074 TaxID=1295534 RepID=A0AAX4K0Y8_9TREE
MSPSCKLCHGPLAAMPAANEVECHASCLPFACPGCIKSNKSSYTILNLKNHIYDYQCQECMIENSSKPLTTIINAHHHHQPTSNNGPAIY